MPDGWLRVMKGLLVKVTVERPRVGCVAAAGLTRMRLFSAVTKAQAAMRQAKQYCLCFKHVVRYYGSAVLERRERGLAFATHTETCPSHTV